MNSTNLLFQANAFIVPDSNINRPITVSLTVISIVVVISVSNNFFLYFLVASFPMFLGALLLQVYETGSLMCF